MRRPISLAHLTVIELSPPEVISVAHDAGYDSVDLRLAKAVPEDIDYPMFSDTPMRRETLQRMSDTGIGVFDIELIRLRRQTRLDDFTPLFEAAARLGAKRVKVSGNDPDERLVTDMLADLCVRVAPYGLAVDLEFMPFSDVRTIGDAERIVRNAAAPNLKILIDSLHLSRSGGSIADVAAVDRNFLGYAQICDAPAKLPPSLAAITDEARVARLIPGEGGLPLAELIRLLPTGAPISLELPMKDLAARMPALERAHRAIAGARKVLAQSE
jgi:sugar phosphate isomerase/epimerase